VDSPSSYITSVFSFKDKHVKSIIHAIKYYHRKDLIAPLVKYASEEISKILKENSQFVLVPIPMPRIRKFMRGYNQASIIAEELSMLLSLPLDQTILIRTRNSKRQVETKTRSERMRNQRGNFGLEGDVSGMDIVLVDDVSTTGATLDEAKNLLLKGGARSVRAVTLAH
jgi:ComF family protein